MLTLLLLLAQSQPVIVSKAEPGYSEEARRAGVNAVVVLSFTVDAAGVPANIRIVDGAGFGLDERSIDALRAWRFKPGVEIDTPVRVEMTFWRENNGPLASLNFKLPDGASRPELLAGHIPEAIDLSKESRLRVSLTVATDGAAHNFSVLENPTQMPTKEVFAAPREWRFRPASVNGQPVQVEGVLTLSRPDSLVRQAMENAAYTSLPAPKLLEPAEGATFSHIPRRVRCRWEPSPGAASYLVEWDYSDSGVWHAEVEHTTGAGFPTRDTGIEFTFVGPQLGRWRVWPIDASGRRGTPSEWRTFSFTR